MWTFLTIHSEHPEIQGTRHEGFTVTSWNLYMGLSEPSETCFFLLPA
ncbi:hypothetical protein ATPR_2873 [Acetobacter tropicalis NBRC 101654]|uniref:Uncharacterized protein n=1 Tax=Acetobacter tropicalis NBRC 101654 TaxID=749388 RepID=F7VHM4_9PROT|nr:hypothetical protein ATPR_2873 [Acetobacter tropicalis NBRC 101654]